MTKILYIQASPRGDRSHSSAVADTFIDALKQNQSDIVVETINLFDIDLPELDAATINAKYNIMHGREHSEEDKRRWKAVEDIIETLKSADKLVFSVPMWNFSLPYRLKHFIDVIAQPTYTFGMNEDGYFGLLEAKAFIAYSRGGEYPDDSPWNFQSNYLTHILNFMGVTDIQTVNVQPMVAAGPEARDTAKANAITQALEIAKDF